jgi:hypothetical protein
MSDKGWQRRFDDPIPLPRGCQLVALEDAGRYITKLPEGLKRNYTCGQAEYPRPCVAPVW